MNAAQPVPIYDHILDVLAAALKHKAQGRELALAFVTATKGGSVRAPGAAMVISKDGIVIGYLSGGCIDSDIQLHAIAALEDRHPRQLKYGLGSPFEDIKLPCGGSIDVLILPHPDFELIAACVDRLRGREVVALQVSADGLSFAADAKSGAALIVEYEPKLALRLAGRGADCLATARLAQSSGIDICLQLPDADDLTAAKRAGLSNVQSLASPTQLPGIQDDEWTAFALMFHDPHWEEALLKQALAGPAFYVGAVGSRATHARRCEALKSAGVSDTEIARIHGPIGMIPAMRDAGMLAVSALAEIVAEFHSRHRR